MPTPSHVRLTARRSPYLAARVARVSGPCHLSQTEGLQVAAVAGSGDRPQHGAAVAGSGDRPQHGSLPWPGQETGHNMGRCRGRVRETGHNMDRCRGRVRRPANLVVARSPDRATYRGPKVSKSLPWPGQETGHNMGRVKRTATT